MSRIQEGVINLDNEIIAKQNEINKAQRRILELQAMKEVMINRSRFYNVQWNGKIANVIFANNLFIVFDANVNKNAHCYEVFNTNIQHVTVAIKSFTTSGAGRLAPKQAKDITVLQTGNANISLYDIICDVIEEYRYNVKNNIVPNGNLMFNGGMY